MQEESCCNRSRMQRLQHTKAIYYTKYKKIPLENQGEFFMKLLFFIVL